MVYTIELKDENSIEELKMLADKNGIFFSVKNSFSDLNESGKKLANALENIAQKGGLKSFGEPTEWQREQRKDRKLAAR